MVLPLVILGLTTCTQAPEVRDAGSFTSEQTVQAEDEEEDHSLHVYELLASENPGLACFRDDLTQDIAIDYFINLTGNEETALPILYNADQADVPLFTAFTISFIESAYRPNAVNQNATSTDRGLFQLNDKAFPELGIQDFFDPDTNARYAMNLVKKLLNDNKGEVVSMAMYNAGKYRVMNNGTPHRTLLYIEKYMKYREKIEREFRSYVTEKLLVKKG